MNSSFLNPKDIVKNLNLHDNMIVADFGCGSGFFSLAMANLIRPSGKIIAIDIWKPALDALNLKAKLAGVYNIIESKQIDLEQENNPTLTKETVDLVLISNMLFQTEQKEIVLQNAWNFLKKDGYLAILEWEPDKLPNAYALKPITKDELLALCQKVGFISDREIVSNETHYGILMKK